MLLTSDVALVDGVVRERFAVRVEDGAIVAAGARADLARPGEAVVDLGRRAMLPGTVNAHNHSLPVAPARLRRRPAVSRVARPGALSLLAAPRPRRRLHRRAVRVRRDGAARRHHRLRLLLPQRRRQRQRARGHRGGARARDAHGAGALLLRLGRRARDVSRDRRARRTQRFLRAAQRVPRRARRAGLPGAALAARRLRGDDPRRRRRRARASACRWHIHLAEEKYQVDDARKRYGTTPLRAIDKMGLLGRRHGRGARLLVRRRRARAARRARRQARLQPELQHVPRRRRHRRRRPGRARRARGARHRRRLLELAGQRVRRDARLRAAAEGARARDGQAIDAETCFAMGTAWRRRGARPADRPDRRRAARRPRLRRSRRSVAVARAVAGEERRLLALGARRHRRLRRGRAGGARSRARARAARRDATSACAR